MKLGSVRSPRSTGFRHIAVTFQKVTGTVAVYLDGVEVVRLVAAVREDAMVFSIGGVAGSPAFNAAGESFGDVRLYRAPLSPEDLQGIFEGRPPWKSIEAWLPLTYASDRESLNLAPSIVTTRANGTWEWSADRTSSGTSDLRPRSRLPY